MKKVIYIILILYNLGNAFSQSQHPLFDQLYGKYEWIGDFDFETKEFITTHRDFPDTTYTFYFSPDLIYIDMEAYNSNNNLIDKFVEVYFVEDRKIMIEDNSIVITVEDKDRYNESWMISTNHNNFPNEVTVSRLINKKFKMEHFILKKVGE